MKKLLTLLLSIMTLMLCLVGCNQVKSTVEFSSYMIGSLIGQEEKTEEDKLVERLKSSGALYAYKIDEQETSTTQIVYVWNNLLRRELRLDIRQIYLSVPDEDKSVTIKIYEDSTVKIDNKNIDFEATSDLSFAVLRAIFPKESTVNAKEFRNIFREMAVRLETLEQFGDTEVIAIQTVTSSELLFGNTEDKEVKLVMPVDDTHTEHTYEWVGSEGGHQKVYTCGCPSPDIAELHSNNDGDYKCDVCGWAMEEELPEEAYLLIQAYEEKYPQAGKATILHYCGTYESGAIVAMLAGSDEGFDHALWTETVADYDFNYSNGNRIRVLYGGEFYTLTQAYENGYLTKENIANIHIKWDGKLPNIEPDEDLNQNGSNDIFYAASYPQDFEYNGRHYRLVQGVGLKTTVTQEELGELLGYIIHEEDVSAFTQEYPNVDYVIDNGIYDYDTSNRVAFYSVKAYPDLSLICMNQLGEYVLFQDITDLLA